MTKFRTEMSKKVSIVIPTYNRKNIWSDSYLPVKSESKMQSANNEILAGYEDVLLSSLLKQTYKNLEIIIVDDGSTDGSDIILDEIAELDSRIKIKHQKNQGQSGARNTGIELATGEFLFFIDDDDYIPVDYIESFMKPQYDKLDLVIDSYSYQEGDSTPIKYSWQECLVNSKNELVKMLVKMDNLYPFLVTAKRFRLDILRKYDIRFYDGIKLGEDRPFCLDYIEKSNSCQIINKAGYIVKSRVNVSYRMSRGPKSVQDIWAQFSWNYNYLLRYYHRNSIEGIVKYADNYLISRTINYIFGGVQRKPKLLEPSLYHNS